MRLTSLQIIGGAQAVAEALRLVRKKRAMTVNEVATRMGMPIRTYEEFEGGRGPITHERIWAFADATDSDPYGFLLAATFDMPEFAISCADTKLALIVMMHLREFAETEGEDIAFIDPLHVIGGLERLFNDLGTKLNDRQTFLRNWMDKRTGSIGLQTLKLRGVKRGKPSP